MAFTASVFVRSCATVQHTRSSVYHQFRQFVSKSRGRNTAMSLVKGVFIVGAKRTAFGTYGGKLKDVSVTELQTIAAKAAIAAGKVDPATIDSVVIGNVMPISATDGIFVPRHVALNSGVPLEKPALGVNRLCGSGFQSIVNGVQDLLTGFSRISLTGGVENMSACPHVARNIRFGVPLGQSPVLEDSLWLGLTDTYCKLPMALTAEKLGEQYGITRDEVDAFALRSQKKWKEAQDAGRFAEELVPVTLKSKKGPQSLSADEHPRPQTTAEGLKSLPTLFKKDGLVTAGSASGICDGAGAVIVATEEAVTAHNLKPLARIVGYSIVGVEPSIMGIGPAPAIKALLNASGKTLNDIDLVEINEAFGAQTLACAKDLGLDLEKLNVDGGAIALGHPLAASGSRITAHLVHELRRRKAKYGIGSACIGGGQGIAILVEAL
ncbi:3-ketoacyl-CoA thiolase, mitochondrial [Cylas formicarius]|uniref:3-ketoacyl-CoA thiolase, mitochondrial n=1 Tax=Cylas formicarius TaxID=197179 RepID=UPI0029588552|nr:3-ketoacyl-CoA thiolase, mitochondrial [Cylas formicarius]